MVFRQIINFIEIKQDGTNSGNTHRFIAEIYENMRLDFSSSK
jgi:hypothetical protein